jgi:hypothetical protein
VSFPIENKKLLCPRVTATAKNYSKNKKGKKPSRRLAMRFYSAIAMGKGINL